MEQPITTKNVGQPCVICGQAADAQATIAALQARVKELEEWVQDQSTANLETMRHMDEMQSRAMDAEAQLTQRTAELEAAKADFVDASTDRDDWITSWRVLQRHNERIEAELERVRGELQSAEAGYFVAERELQGANNKYDELRTLIAALPKVEGEIAVKRTEVDLSDVWGITLNGYFTFQSALFDGKEEAESYAAILKHRQGME